MEVTLDRKREVVAIVDVLVSHGFEIPKLKVYTTKGPSTRFGQPLNEIPHEELIRTTNGLKVPRVFYDLLRYLEHNGGMQTPGIFRLNGSSRKITMAKETLNEGKQLPSDTPITVLSGLMKGYLRDQPEGILAPVRDMMLQAQDIKKVQPIVLVSIIKLLPPQNHDLFLFLIHMLSKIDAKATKMDTKNLSLVFAVNLFHQDPKTEAKKKAKTALDAKEEEGKLSEIVATLVDHVNLFKRFKSELQNQGGISNDSDEKIAKRYNRFANVKRRRSSLNMVKENIWNSILPTRRSQNNINLSHAATTSKKSQSDSSETSNKRGSKKKRSFKSEPEFGSPLDSGKRRRSDIMKNKGSLTPKQPTTSSYAGMDSRQRVPFPKTPTLVSKSASRVHTPSMQSFRAGISRRGKSRSGYGLSPFKPSTEPLIKKNRGDFRQDLNESVWSAMKSSKNGDNIYEVLKKDRLFSLDDKRVCPKMQDTDDCQMVDKHGNLYLNLPV